jgi:AcrR family transcriptional regulator
MDKGGRTSSSAAKNRSERRREDTRRRLMKATYEIIARRGHEGLVIQDITEAADVGYGSFYNHFSSKEAIVDAVIEAALAHGAAVYGRVAAMGTDRIETFAMELRSCLELSQTDPVWGWFIIRSMLSGQHIRIAMAERLKRAIEGGIAAGMFAVEDAEMTRHTIGGLLLVGTLKIVNGEAGADYPRRVAQTALRLLGVAETKVADALARPMPDVAAVPFLEAA